MDFLLFVHVKGKNPFHITLNQCHPLAFGTEYMGLTVCEDNNMLGIFFNCSNILYLLRVLYGLHFSTFSNI
jgi:hypothetical protein